MAIRTGRSPVGGKRAVIQGQVRPRSPSVWRRSEPSPTHEVDRRTGSSDPTGPSSAPNERRRTSSELLQTTAGLPDSERQFAGHCIDRRAPSALTGPAEDPAAGPPLGASARRRARRTRVAGCRSAGRGRYLFATSDHVIPEPEPKPVDESAWW